MHNSTYTPKYMKIRNTLAEKIVHGVYKPGETIPSDNELMRSLNVSKSTITQALKVLAADGYIVRQQGKGSFVTDRALQQTTLSLYLCPMEHGEEQFWTALVNQFNESNQSFRVEVTFLSHGTAPLRDVLFQGFASGHAPDIFSLDGPDVPYWAYMNSLLPLDDYLDQEFLSSLLDTIIQQGLYRGKLYHLGYTESTLCILYNKELFRSLGIRIPKTVKESWSWEEFTDICRLIQKKTSYHCPLLMDSGRGLYPKLGEWITFSGLPFILQNNGTLFNRDFTRTEGFMNSPATVRAMRWLGELFHKYHFTHVDDRSADFPWDFAMSLSLPSAYFRACEQTDNVGLIPLPHGIKFAAPHGSWGLCMSRQTRYPQECSQFIKYIYTFQNQLKIRKYTGIPVLKEIYEVMENFQTLPETTNILLSQLYDTSFTRPQTPAYPFFSKQFAYTYYNIANGADAQKELDLMARLVDDHLFRHNFYQLQ